MKAKYGTVLSRNSLYNAIQGIFVDKIPKRHRSNESYQTVPRVLLRIFLHKVSLTLEGEILYK